MEEGRDDCSFSVCLTVDLSVCRSFRFALISFAKGRVIGRSAFSYKSRMDRQMDRRMDRKMERRMNGLIDGQTDGRTDGQTNEQVLAFLQRGRFLRESFILQVKEDPPGQS